MEKINAELGKVVCDELAFNDAVATMITDITTVSSRAIKVLREHFKDEVTDDEATLCTFADTAKFEDFISTSRDSYLGNIKFVPFEEKDRVCRLYQELHDTCISFVKDLQRLYGLGYTLQYDGAKLIPDKAEIEKNIKKNFIVSLTDEQREYYTKLAAVHNAIEDLNAYETEHKLNEFSVRGYSDIKFGIYKKIEPFPYFLKFDEANYIDGLKTGMFFNED
jgi:predicted transposase YbfD/YdcC